MPYRNSWIRVKFVGGGYSCVYRYEMSQKSSQMCPSERLTKEATFVGI